MNGLQDNSTLRRGKAAKMADDYIEKLSTMLDRVRTDTIVSVDGAQPVPMWAALNGQLGSASHRLRATSGEQVVNYAKEKVARHPTLVTLAAAATATAIAQLTVAAIRRERREPISNDLENTAL